MAKLIKIHPKNPQQRAINHVVDVIRDGGVIIYPTDTIYSLGCDVTNIKAMERLARVKGVKLAKSYFSMVCNDLSHLSEYTRPIDNNYFKLLKKTLPGPFTYILKASKKMPSAYKNRKTVGIRVPDHLVPKLIVEELGSPIASTSVYDDDEIVKYTTDPEVLAEKYDKLVDVIIDSGFGNNKASTVVDITTDEPKIVRQGAGNINPYL